MLNVAYLCNKMINSQIFGRIITTNPPPFFTLQQRPNSFWLNSTSNFLPTVIYTQCHTFDLTPRKHGGLKPLKKAKSYTDEYQWLSDQSSGQFFICQLQTLKMTSKCVLNELWPAAVCSPWTSARSVTLQEKRNKTEQNRKTNASERVNLPAHHHHGPILPLSIATESPGSHYRLRPPQSDSLLSLAFLHTVPLLINIFC